MSHEQDQFWTVIGRRPNGEANGPSSVVHTTAKAADAEARRLASAHIGVRFYVMAAAVGYVVEKPDPVAVTIKRPDAAAADHNDLTAQIRGATADDALRVRPTVMIRGGCFYRLRNGTVVGPARLVDPGSPEPWVMGGAWYVDDGTCPGAPSRDAIAEVPAP